MSLPNGWRPALDQLLTIIMYTALAGLALPLGGVVASVEHIRPQWLEEELRHGLLALGGGLLLAAVALVLVPHAMQDLGAITASITLLMGGAVFLMVDKLLTQIGKPASNLLAALLDFIPEAMALGALISSEASIGALLAVFIGLQNLPEGFNAQRELVANAHMSNARGVQLLFASALLGPVCGLLGYWWLTDAPEATAITMLFGAGGILYLVFQDIAPQVKLERHWGPPLGAVIGFALGLLGTMLIAG